MIWDHLGSSKLGSPGMIGDHLGSSGPSGIIRMSWDHMGGLGARLGEVSGKSLRSVWEVSGKSFGGSASSLGAPERSLGVLQDVSTLGLPPWPE